MYELILRCGSCGPGIIPASIMFSSLYLKARGKFMMVNKITPTEYDNYVFIWLEPIYIYHNTE